MFDLKEILNEAEEIKSANKKIELEKEKLASKRREEVYNSDLVYWRRKLSENDYLKNLIKDAIIEGHDSIQISSGDRACTEIIDKEYPGLNSDLKFGKTRYSDDTDEVEYTYVVVNWYVPNN